MKKAAIITGATSGIGRALASELARRGYALGLTGRRGEVLAKAADEIRSATGAHVETEVLDVDDTAAVREAIPRLAERLGGVGLVVANAGVGGQRQVGDERFSVDEQIVRTNVLGAMATVDAAVKLFRASGGGHVVGITSVAGYRGLPGNAAYSASKAALHTYLEGVRAEVQGEGITVTTLAPGYIDTPINRHIKSRPFLVSVEDGAAQVADLIERGVQDSTVPVMPWTMVGLLIRNLPDFVWYRALRSQAGTRARETRDPGASG